MLKRVFDPFIVIDIRILQTFLHKCGNELSTRICVVGSQRNLPNETVPMSTQNTVRVHV